MRRDSKHDSRNYLSLIILKMVSVNLILLLLGSCNPSGYRIYCPYERVDWVQNQQYKASLHVHTVCSDGRLNPHVVVDEYHKMGFSILAITDHDKVTYPWSEFTYMKPGGTSLRRYEENPDGFEQPFVFENRDARALHMIDIQSNEVSAPHHVGSFFSDFGGRFDEEEETFMALKEAGSVVTLFHPGRYTGRNPAKYNDEWYINQLTNFDNIVGVEVYNQGDRYPKDRALWDRLLVELMPQRQIWAFSNDDMHGRNALGRNWNVFVLPELSHDAVKEGMIQGLFYYVYAPEGHDGPAPPSITNITTNKRKATIMIEADKFNEILWISANDTIQRGTSGILNLKEFNLSASYVRAEIWGEAGSVTGTQAFGIKTR
jgi:hypothetical protein